MGNEFIVVRMDGDGYTMADTVEVLPSIEDPEKAMRAAVKEYLQTPKGKQDAIDLCGFNWGDALRKVPKEIWNKHGVLSYVRESKRIVLDNDEYLDRTL